MSHPSNPYPPNRMIRLIDLRFSLVHSPEQEEHAIEPFILPPLPLSQETWIRGLGIHFYRYFTRGISLLLLLDVDNRQWARPFIPIQRCTREGSSFQVLPRNFENVPESHRVAGSFQWAAFTEAEEAEALVPAFDGLHLVYWQRGHCLSLTRFLRTEGRLQPTEPQQLIVDDWLGYLEKHSDRLIVP